MSYPARHTRALTLVLGLLPLFACQGDPNDSDDVGDTGDDPGLELPGQPLAQREFCEGDPLPAREFDNASLAELGACGDALLFANGTLTLVPIDGEPEALDISNNSMHTFSPRGRQLAMRDWSAGTLLLRDLAAGTSFEFAVEDPVFNFAISKQRPGARLWLCDGGQLDLVVDGERVELADNVVCPSVASSPMYSLLVFATSEGTVWWADTDAQSVTPTSLAGFEYDPSNELGVRHDALAMAPSGAYMLHFANTVETYDGESFNVAFDTVLFDLAHDGVVLENEPGLLLSQAKLFEAPLFATKPGAAWFAIHDGTASSLGIGVQQLQGGVDSALALMVDGRVVRHAGEGFVETALELSASPENAFIFTSTTGTAGYAVGPSEVCATPECGEFLFSLHGFGGEISSERLLARNLWPQIHVSEDGTLVTDAIIVDGTVDDWSLFPYPRLLVLAPDGSATAEWEHHPDASIVDYAPLGEDRIVVAYRDAKRPDALMIVDPSAGTIEQAESYPDENGDVEFMWADASGRVVVLQISNRIRIVAP